MNTISAIGRLCYEPELRQDRSGNNYLVNTLASSRGYKDDNNEYVTDFIPFIAREKRAELIANFCKKGDRISVTGNLQSYNNDKGYTNYSINALSVEFIEDKRHEKNP